MLTDWADRSQIPKEATMPVHYGAARYEHSLRTKRILRLPWTSCWTMRHGRPPPEQTYQEALESARANVDKVLQQSPE